MSEHTDWQEPFTRFSALFEEAKRRISKDPNAMSLATVDGDGRPSVRTVLLKDFDATGFVFFTNYQSRKGRALLDTKVACLNFYWPSLDQQVRIEGTVEPVSALESDAYFATRPRQSQLGAWASHQSEPLSSRSELVERLAALTQRYEGQQVPRPPHWGGFRLAPDRIELWQADPFRLHVREVYVKAGAGWARSLLNP